MSFKKNSAITQARLKELMSYKESTGVFTWIKPTSNRVKAGSVANTNDGRGYIRITIDGVQYRAHRLAILYSTGNLPAEEVDHLNRVKSDNRLVNLKVSSHAENGRNRALSSNNVSGIHGVRYRKERNCWTAKIEFDGAVYNLGHFKDLFEAVCARKSAEREYGFSVNHGQVAI